MNDATIEVSGLRKRFGPAVALDGMSFRVGPGLVAVLGGGGVPFSEVSAHRAALEEAYLELTRDAVEFRAAAAPEAAR